MGFSSKAISCWGKKKWYCILRSVPIRSIIGAMIKAAPPTQRPGNQNVSLVIGLVVFGENRVFRWSIILVNVCIINRSIVKDCLFVCLSITGHIPRISSTIVCR